MSAAPKNIVWIASYPKSGNTWVRFLACNLLYGRQESAAALNVLAPDIHEMAGSPEAPAPSGLLKTHFAWSAALPHAERTAAAIYVVRDPADVLASNFFYSQRSAARSDASPAAFSDYVEAFIAHRGDPRWIERGMGSWEHNVRSWLNTPLDFPVLRIRYEDMVGDPMSACRAMAQMLRPDSTDSDIRQAVENSGFERMREVERADIRDKRVGIFYKPYLQASIDSGSRFMRRGVVGDGFARLSADQRLRLRSAVGPLLRELGY
ncbi:MAG: sulfotransferase domain-containing protein [Steroidobacteraceae bacterium]